MEALADEVDVIFTATPQGLCASLVNEGDSFQGKGYRSERGFPNQGCGKCMKSGTGLSIRAPQFIEEAVYGLCEINREAM